MGGGGGGGEQVHTRGSPFCTCNHQILANYQLSHTWAKSVRACGCGHCSEEYFMLIKAEIGSNSVLGGVTI